MSVQPENFETPVSRSVVRAPQRRHRWLTVPSGWVLFICAGLPTIRFCNNQDSLPGFVLPWFWPFYLMGVLVAFAAIAAPFDWRGRLVLGLIWGTVVAGDVLVGENLANKTI